MIFKFGRLHIFKKHKNEYIKTINQKLINNLRTSRLIKKKTALMCIDTFLKTKFEGGHHTKRVKKI